MNTSKLVILILISSIGYNKLTAQQLPQFSQYMLNPYLINPAVGGTSDHYDIKAGYRNQWVGLTDKDQNGNVYSVSPQTIYATAHGHIGKDHQRLRGRHKNQNTWHHGVGLQVIADRTGPTSMNTFRASYAYDMSLTKYARISFGAFVGVQTWGIDASKIRLNDGTNNFPLTNTNKVLPDLGLGIWVYHKLYYIGLSVDQLLMSSLGARSIYTNYPNGNQIGTLRDNGIVNRLTQHYYFTAGGIFHPSREIAVIPSFLVKSNLGSPAGGTSIDINTKVRYNNLVWGGLSYRFAGNLANSDAFVVLIGMLIDKRFDIGYSYDFTLSPLIANSYGSHELMVGYRLEPRAHVMSPSDFW